MSLVIKEALSSQVLKIILNDPENLNAMSEKMASEFRLVVDSIKQEASKLSAIILTGAGKAFSAGGDLAMLDAKRSKQGEENRLGMQAFYNSFLSLLDLGIPLIAAINGTAVGAGLCVASACDIRIVATEAKLGFTFVRLGLHPGMGATYFLPRNIGFSAAAELLLTGRMIDASEALRIGLVSRVCPASEVLGEATKVAAEISSGGRQSIRMLLETLRRPSHGLAAALEREALCQAINYASDEFKEGIAAIREKRAPKF